MFRIIYYARVFQNWVLEKTSNKKLEVDWDNAVIFMLACDYNNAGDVLIREAQYSFLEQNTNNKCVVVIPLSETTKYLKDIYKNSTDNTIITLTGGGNTGDRYTSMERVRNRVVKKMSRKKSLIVGFPQTVDYSKTQKGLFYIRKANKAYAKNKNFVFFAREKESYKIARNIFPNVDIRLAPDIALSYKPSRTLMVRDGIGTLLRHDKEKSIRIDDQEKILKSIVKKYGNIEENDMISNEFDAEKTISLLDEKINFVCGKKVIITDRLHGMILCYITKTPCVVFSNSNHKVRETFFNWLDGRQNYISYIDNVKAQSVNREVEKLLRVIPETAEDENYEELKQLFK